MGPRAKQTTVQLTAKSAGIVTFAAIAVMIGGYIDTCQRAPADKDRLANLEQAAKQDDSQSPALVAEQERQTDASLVRAARNDFLTYVLVAAAVAFLVSIKRLIALRPRRLPELHAITSARSTKPGRARRNGRRSPPELRAEESPCACAVDEIDLTFVDETVAKHGRREATVIPVLQAIQSHYRYLPEVALERVCELTDITPARITGVSSFYTQFRRTPVGEHLVRVCHGTACHVAGAEAISNEIRRELGIQPGADTDPRRQFTVEPVACMGCCTLAPVVQVDGVTYGHLAPDTVPEILRDSVYATGNGVPRSKKVLAAKPSEHYVPLGEIRIGLGSCCVAGGSGKVYEALEQAVAATGARATIKRVGCVGMCHQTPLVETVLPGQPSSLYAGVGPEDARSIVRRHFRPRGLGRRITTTASTLFENIRSNEGRPPTSFRSIEVRDPPVAAFLGRQKHIATEHCGHIDPTDLDEYLHRDGFKALERCVKALTPAEVIGEIQRSGLRGRGGAGYPTGLKWTKVRNAPGDQKFIICNGDEGDPGAFMDRMLMESFPFRIVEGMAIAAYTIGANEGYFYIRAEYPLAVQRIREALRECEARGFIGDNVLGTGVRLQLRIMEGAGAFVCGEETALLASIEGNRGSPRLRPPYPAESGLWGKPTLVGNVETYATVPWIIRNGAETFAELGTTTSKGTKVFALAGKVKRGGLIEVPMGITIRHVVEEIGGGIKEDRPFKAVQIGGPSGGCIPAALADTAVDYEALTEVGAIMGSGGLVVLDESDCMVDIARYFLSFTQDQSCGKCTFCRIGTRRMLDILDRLCEGEGKKGDLETLEQLAHAVKRGSLCGLGKTAPNPALSTLQYFRDEYEAHLERRCPAGKCKTLITYRVTDDCIGCTLCAQHCPAEAIAFSPYQKHEIDDETCVRCDTCRAKCPEDAIEVVPRVETSKR